MLAGLDLFRQRSHAQLRAASEAAPQFRGGQGQDVQLDDRNELEERVIAVAKDVVVQGQRVARLDQSPAAGHDLVVPDHVLEDLHHHLARGEREPVLADQERPRGVDKGQLAAHEALQAEVETGVHQHIGGHGVAARPARGRAPEQQLVAAHLVLCVEHWLAPDHEVVHTKLRGPFGYGGRPYQPPR